MLSKTFENMKLNVNESDGITYIVDDDVFTRTGTDATVDEVHEMTKKEWHK